MDKKRSAWINIRQNCQLFGYSLFPLRFFYGYQSTSNITPSLTRAWKSLRAYACVYATAYHTILPNLHFSLLHTV